MYATDLSLRVLKLIAGQTWTFFGDTL